MSSRLAHLDDIFRRVREAVAPYESPAVASGTLAYPRTPFTTLISCLLSLRTKDEVTGAAARRLLSKYPTPQALASQPVEALAALIYPVGFYKTKAVRIKEISQTLIDTYAGEVPRDFSQLLTLKGVGRKTASIVMVYGFHDHGFLPIDSHCHQVANRLGWVKTTTPDETEHALRAVLPEEYWDEFNDLFVTFGKHICVPISPFCNTCPIARYCPRIGVRHHR